MKRDQQARFIFNKYATDYQAKYMSVEHYAVALDLFCKYVKPEGTKLLEIGCGPGNLTKYLLSKRPGLDILGIDIAENMIHLARKNNPGAEFKLMDCREIDGLKQKFDAVVCGFCLPYLSRTETSRLFKMLSELMHHGAILYLSTMEVTSEISEIEASSDNLEKLYINYYESQFLEELLTQFRFKILETFKINNPLNHESVNDLIILAEKA